MTRAFVITIAVALTGCVPITKGTRQISDAPATWVEIKTDVELSNGVYHCTVDSAGAAVCRKAVLQ